MGPSMIETKYSGAKILRMRSGIYIKELDSLIYIKDYDMVFYLLQYNLKDGTWKEVVKRPFETNHIANSHLHLKRENENEVSFNTEKSSG